MDVATVIQAIKKFSSVEKRRVEAALEAASKSGSSPSKTLFQQARSRKESDVWRWRQHQLFSWNRFDQVLGESRRAETADRR